jgi:membrane protease YdiL (CAAX protease family)
LLIDVLECDYANAHLTKPIFKQYSDELMSLSKIVLCQCGKMTRSELRNTLLIAFGALMISLTARGREGGAFSFLITLWVVMECILRRKDWKSMGFRRDNFWQELKCNFWLIAFVGIVVQVVFWLIAEFFYKPLGEQIAGRIAVLQTWIPSLSVLSFFICYQTLAEEIAFRGFIQNRLASAWGIPVAISIGALSFAGFHWQVHARLTATIIDLLFVAFDGAIYGWIFNRSGNIFVTWFAHLLADFTSLGLLIAN